MYEGFGARLLFQRVIETVVPSRERHRPHPKYFATPRPTMPPGALGSFRPAARSGRVSVALSRHMVAYQAQLDRVKSLAWSRANPRSHASSWIAGPEWISPPGDRQHRPLRRLLQGTAQPILDLAPTAGEETIMRLGPNLVAQLQRKIDLMNAHWMDYDRLFTVPNP